ncbi:ankyrin repeat domain-containing protein [Pedobacter punctiformis]|uniref:Ankyrin repeat domain-containing protein n=1 Tax=Pedobacter punctiformis TaxID=3004097 RepID=A0ABT4L659_9SPHI|nr:ankyrin repeat domain-containing protein [Pedobacter sp. HCMS5-2]MCZ4243311.1 ankyrin repeat domain-containing protein [Pedobacter sp. HCMS5-2]
MNLTEIRYAYLEGKELSEINEMYKSRLSDLSDELQFEVWKQVCIFANVEMITYLLSQGWRAAGVEDKYGNTLLHIMAEAEQLGNYFILENRIYETTKLLLEAKVSPLRKNNDGETAIMIGVKNGYFEMLQAYEELGAKSNFTDRNGNTLLHILAQYSYNSMFAFETAREQLEYNYQSADFNENSQRDVQKRSELEWHFNVKQARVNHFITFALLLLEFGADPHQKNNEGETAIDVSVRYKSKPIGAILNGVDLSNQETAPLYFKAGGMNVFQACIYKDTEALNALIQLGENLNEEYDKEGDRYQGMTPLSIAMVLHHFDCIDLLLKNGADPYRLDSKSWHPFRYLYIPESNINTNSDQFNDKTFPRILKSYIETGFDINSLLDDDENTLLTISAKYADGLTLYNSNSVAKVLIEEAVYSNADVNKTNREGISALMYLCLGDSQRAEKNLVTVLEQGASTELKDKNGKTALIYAVNNPDKSVAKTYCELLAEFGNLLIDSKDNSGKSALDYAVENNNENLVAWLLERE